MKWDCQGKLDVLITDFENKLDEYIEMLHIQALSQLSNETIKVVDKKLIEIFLKKRGYTMNYMLNKTVMVKDFTVVYIADNYVEVWHDINHNNKSVFVNQSMLTGLPITLNYMERL